VFGSGDAKYYAAAAAWFPLDQAMVLLGGVSVAGFAIALFWIIRARRSPDRVNPASDFAKVPFGVAIALGSAAAALKALI
jgi:prepilin peptidase CpaA